MAVRGVLIAVIAVGLAGCGSSGSSSSSSKTSSAASAPGATTVTLSLAGGTGNLNAVKCGKQEPFEHYPAPAQVQYSGMVSPAPSGRWKVKIKLKICRGGGFVDVSSQKIVGQTSGRYDGIFSITAPGAYSLRTELEGKTPKPVSPKQYLQVG